ncbi:uncharacterized protein EI97DRAFT_458172 [Westerdykella ornata]|uniref:20S proteasome chaperone domain-containing protein n=1 Tax=Westerdykella ornata TaxID=318751 RepID=A0A6A6JL57_WESOR|nr:uncharacterized protein EI97DRAFT_458172 [Westerdykella ornata]KAF2276843.1 hypothetical protein EI97DRAFT_458172 [Westerdykella ornata]
MAASMVNGTALTTPIEVSFPLPRAPQTNAHLQLTDNRTCLVIFLTTTTSESSTLASLGSFVYAMPNRSSPSDVFSTPLYTYAGNLDFTTRLAKVLARKAGKPVYVGNSISFASAGMGGTVEEEMEGFRRCVEVVMGLLRVNEKKVDGD